MTLNCEPKELFMYTKKEINQMKEAWFFVGAGAGTLITIVTTLVALRFLGDRLLQ